MNLLIPRGGVEPLVLWQALHPTLDDYLSHTLLINREHGKEAVESAVMRSTLHSCAKEKCFQDKRFSYSETRASKLFSYRDWARHMVTESRYLRGEVELCSGMISGCEPVPSLTSTSYLGKKQLFLSPHSKTIPFQLVVCSALWRKASASRLRSF